MMIHYQVFMIFMLICLAFWIGHCAVNDYNLVATPPSTLLAPPSSVLSSLAPQSLQQLAQSVQPAQPAQQVNSRFFDILEKSPSSYFCSSPTRDEIRQLMKIL